MEEYWTNLQLQRGSSCSLLEFGRLSFICKLLNRKSVQGKKH